MESVNGFPRDIASNQRYMYRPPQPSFYTFLPLLNPREDYDCLWTGITEHTEIEYTDHWTHDK